MRLSALFLIPSLGLFVFARETYTATRNASIQKRQLMTCEQTFGAGSVVCGGAGSTFCYNPGAGQSCCTADNGYCDKGSYCAPVAGYCCIEGVDLATCAQNANFTLPGSGSATVPAPTVAVTVSPFLSNSAGASSTTDMASTPTAGSSPSNSNNATGPVKTTPATISNTTVVPPFIQVSLAFKLNRKFFESTLTVGIAGVLAAFVWI